MTRRAVILTRVSTGRQVDGTSLDEQERMGRAECDRLAWQVVAVLADPGVSGGDLDRPALNDAMARFHSGEADALVVQHQDRLARDETVRHLVERDLKQLGVAYRPLNLPAEMDPFDEAEGEMTAGMFGVFSQYLRRKNQWNAARGQRAKAQDERWPGGSPPYGWRLEGARKEATAVPDDAERQVIATAVGALVDQGLTTGETAALLNGLGLFRRSGGPWVHQKVRQQFERRTLVGEMWWGQPTRKHNAGHHTRLLAGKPKYGEPILVRLPDPPLTEERFEALQRALSGRATGSKREAEPYPLAGRMFAPCGTPYGGVTRRKPPSPQRPDGYLRRQYRCRDAVWKGPNRPQCDDLTLHAPEVEARVWTEVAALLRSPEKLRALADEYRQLSPSLAAGPDQAQQLDQQIAERERWLTQTVTDYARAGIPVSALKAATDSIQAELQQLRRQRAALVSWQDHGDSLDRNVDELATVAARRLAEPPSPRWVAEVFALLDLRVTVLDVTNSPQVHVQGGLLFERLLGLLGSSGTGVPRWSSCSPH